MSHDAKKSVPQFVMDVAQYLNGICRLQHFYPWIALGLFVLACFPPAFDIRLALASVCLIVVGGFFMGMWYQNRRTITELLQHDYFDMMDLEGGFYDRGNQWLPNLPEVEEAS